MGTGRAIIADRRCKIEGQDKSAISRLLEERSIGKRKPCTGPLARSNRRAQLEDRGQGDGKPIEGLFRRIHRARTIGADEQGKDRILPTGRNFFSLDPSAVPTEAAWMVGRRLADSLLEK